MNFFDLAIIEVVYYMRSLFQAQLNFGNIYHQLIFYLSLINLVILSPLIANLLSTSIR
jgi:hypothetical protein